MAIPLSVQGLKGEDEENKDFCFGKPKEFFMVYGADLTKEISPFNHPVTNSDQAIFMFTYYPEYAFNPFEMLLWLYNLAYSKEVQ